MISLIAISTVVLVLLLALMQTLLVVNYRWFFRDAAPIEQDDDNLPSAAIILCLRGSEEGIPDCLAELIGQDYPDFELHIAFDAREDLAVQQVEDFFENHNANANSNANAKLHFFEPLPNCSYKCSGIVHVLGQLNEKFEVIAFCDGDAIVDTNWLRDLISPMLDDQGIGATTGNRWFDPAEATAGALVRKHWNAAAIVQMQAYDIAWGGSMAVRRSSIEKCGLIEIWSGSFCEDTALTAALESNALRLHRVPNLIIENNESVTLKNCYDWIARQLLTVRLHHPGWPLVKAHGVITGIATLGAPLIALPLLATGYFIAARSILIAWLVYQGLNVILLTLIEHCNRSAMAQRESSANDHQVPKPSLGLRIWSLFLVQLLHPLAVIRAMRMEIVEWRGITYQLRADGQICVTNVEEPSAAPNDADLASELEELTQDESRRHENNF